MPAARERCYDGAFPTGQITLKAPENVAVPSREHSLFRAWTDLCDRVAIMTDALARVQVRITCSGAFGDLALWAPPAQDAIAPESCTCAISATFLEPEQSGGPTILMPGASITAGMRLSVEHL